MKRLNSPTWQLAVAAFRLMHGTAWRRWMRRSIGTDENPRGVFDCAGEAVGERAETILKNAVAKRRADLKRLYADALKRLDAADAAIDAAAQAREQSSTIVDFVDVWYAGWLRERAEFITHYHPEEHA